MISCFSTFIAITVYKLQMHGWFKKIVLSYSVLESLNVLWYNFPSTSLSISVSITNGWCFCTRDNIHWVTVSLLHSNMYLMVFPSSLLQEWPTYSSHWTEALSSVARTKKLRIRAPKFPLLQLLMATPLQMLEVDSSNSFPSELNKQQQMFKGTARKTIVYRHNEKKSVYNHNW